MSEVYLAEDTRLKRPIALKVLRKKFSEDELSLKRFQQEAFAASALNHPHILTVYDIGYEAGTHFIATEFLQGEPLRKVIERGPLSVNDALNIASQVADALGAAHRAGIIHRDVKPENIMIGANQHVKLLDFGIAKLLSQPPGSTLETLPGILIGTPIYMSPEQARGEAVTQRSDVWSLGVVLYEMLAGKPPFSAATVSEVIKLILESDPASLSTVRAEVTSEIVSLVTTAIAKDPNDRFEDATQLLLQLNQTKESIQRKSSDSGMKITVQDEPQLVSQPTNKRQQGKMINSIAILPFQNRSSYDNAEYASDGLTETIINKLSQLPQLRVLSRNSVFAFKDSSEDSIAIGKKLGVGAVLTGRLMRFDTKLVVSTELVNVSNGFQLWGDHFSRTMADIFEIQEEIACEISEQLQLKLSRNQRKKLAKRHTLNEQAYLSYLKGRFQWNKRSAEGLKLAVDHFNEAIGLEPLYALAHAGLADAYVALGALHSLPSREAYSKARAAALTALEIDSSLAEAYATLGFVMATLDRDWLGSEDSFQKALRLNASYATAHQWYSVVLRSLGRFDEAIEESQKAQELDPLSPIINATVGQCFYFARRYDEAIKLYRRMLAVEANYRWTHYLIACAYREKGWYDKAILEFEEALKVMPGEPVVISDLAYTYAISGEKEAARAKLAELEEHSKRTYVSPYDLAIAYLGLGDKEVAFTLLEQAHKEHDDGLLMIKIDPLLDSVRSEDRFRAILKQVGLG